MPEPDFFFDFSCQRLDATGDDSRHVWVVPLAAPIPAEVAALLFYTLKNHVRHSHTPADHDLRIESVTLRLTDDEARVALHASAAAAAAWTGSGRLEAALREALTETQVTLKHFPKPRPSNEP